jgi:hypothetical protein
MAPVCVGLYLLMSVLVFFAIIHKTHGHFIYTLDDPYIHLALAENVSHGHYGINADEFSSPSSSAIWPLLLIPFSGKSWHVFLPLVWNLLFGALAAWLIGTMMDRWPNRNLGSNNDRWRQVITAGLLIMVANLVGLTFIGMEHVLQVLLTIACAFAITETLDGRPIPAWCLCAAVIGPMVRYENLAITVGIAILLTGLKRRKTAAAVLLLAILPLIGFGFFLHSIGLPWLPTSVLFKGGAADPNLSRAVALSKILPKAILTAIKSSERWPLVILLFIFWRLAWMEKDRVRRFCFAGVGVVVGLHLLIGRFGWFHRYEIYALVFAVLILMHVLAERPRFMFGYFVLSLVFLGSISIGVTLNSARAADDIYGQQYQMHRFIESFYSGAFAVNDLGLVSYQKPSGSTVVDLLGLGSPEAARQTIKDAPWLRQITQRHGVSLAMIYPNWYNSIPEEWTPMGKMCLLDDPVVLTNQCVVFYSTTPDARQKILNSLQLFAPTLPPEDKFTFFSDRDSANRP